MTENDLPSAAVCAESWGTVFRLFGTTPSAWLQWVELHCPDLLAEDGVSLKVAKGCSLAQIQRYAMARGANFAVPKKPARDVLRQVFGAALTSIVDDDDRAEAQAALKRALSLSKAYYPVKTLKGASGAGLPAPDAPGLRAPAQPPEPEIVSAPVETQAIVADLRRICDRVTNRTEAEECILCLADMSKYLAKYVSIGGDESRYFKRWLEIFREVDREIVIAYIRPLDNMPASWFESFYRSLMEAVTSGRLEISYIFFEASRHASSARLRERFKPLSENIQFVCPEDFKTTSVVLKTSFVLFTKQKVALTFERDDNGVILNSSEWRTPRGYDLLEALYNEIKESAYSAECDRAK